MTKTRNMMKMILSRHQNYPTYSHLHMIQFLHTICNHLLQFMIPTPFAVQSYSLFVVTAVNYLSSESAPKIIRPALLITPLQGRKNVFSHSLYCPSVNCLLMVSYHYRSYTIRTQTSENPPTTKAAFLSQEVDRLFNLDHMAAAIPATLEITTLRKTTSKATTNRD